MIPPCMNLGCRMLNRWRWSRVPMKSVFSVITELVNGGTLLPKQIYDIWLHPEISQLAPEKWWLKADPFTLFFQWRVVKLWVVYPPVNYHSHGTSPNLLINKHQNGGFSMAMYLGVYPLGCVDYKHRWWFQIIFYLHSHLSNEKKPGCLGYIGDDILPRYKGIIS